MYVYVCSCNKSGLFKVGSSLDPQRRLLDLRRKYPDHDLEFAHIHATPVCRLRVEMETHVLLRRAARRVGLTVGRGKWREWFRAELDDIKATIALAEDIVRRRGPPKVIQICVRVSPAMRRKLTDLQRRFWPMPMAAIMVMAVEQKYMRDVEGKP